MRRGVRGLAFENSLPQSGIMKVEDWEVVASERAREARRLRVGVRRLSQISSGEKGLRQK